MGSFDWTKFKGSRILLFEELAHHGRSLDGKRKELCRLAGPNVTIKSASFAVWYRCQYPPDYFYHGSVDSQEYSDIREDIIRILQVYGSLLLDTEHIELPLRVDCSVKEFYNQLARASHDGNAISFLSSSKRLNLTLLDPDILEPEELQRKLTPGSTIDSVVRKCRVIERTQNQFSIMPIFYPNVRHCVTEAWINGLPHFVMKDRLMSATPKEVFYVVGLLASIELLRGVIAAMTDLLKAGKVILETPEDNLKHLSAMFPAIVDVQALWQYVADTVATSRQRKSSRSVHSVFVKHVAQDDLLNMSYFVINNLRKQIDEAAQIPGLPKGYSWRQLYAIAKMGKSVIDAPEGAWTAVPDRLIDAGLLVTNVDEITNSKNETWAIRTFSPDSEIVMDKLRRHASVIGEKWLPRT
jgi:hypothetical protein